MIRLFKQHSIRFQEELEGYWDFDTIKSKGVVPSTYSRKLMVPGCWEQDIALCDYRGLGVYRKELIINETGHYRITFKGVSHTALVYLDSQFLGEHYNAYTEFSFILPQLTQGIHELRIIVDNSFNENSALHIPNDYYTYGGIIRPVVLERIHDLFIEQLHFTSVKKNDKWYGLIDIDLHNISDKNQIVNLKFQLEDITIDVSNTNDILIMSNTKKSITYEISFDEIKEWSQATPYLYLLKALIYQVGILAPIDDLIERIGFRQVQVKGQQLLLNGDPLCIKGLNRHEDFNLVGCAIPLQLAAIDIALLKDLNANSVRTSHYPNDERFLDMCDEQGLLIWEENHARGLSLEEMQHPNFDKQCEACNNEMVAQHYNHPSIIIWGILNECSSDTQEGREMYKKQLEQIKALDQSRPLTFASCQHFADICFDLVDIVSTNIYHAWYGESKSFEEIEAAYLQHLEWIQTTAGKDKPLIISEFGAGGIYGSRSPHQPKWSEERQADILDKCLQIYCSRPEIIGTYIWQFCDCRVTDEVWSIKRPRGLNNKGIVDEYRRPKLAYTTVKNAYK